MTEHSSALWRLTPRGCNVRIHVWCGIVVLELRNQWSFRVFQLGRRMPSWRGRPWYRIHYSLDSVLETVRIGKLAFEDNKGAQVSRLQKPIYSTTSIFTNTVTRFLCLLCDTLSKCTPPSLSLPSWLPPLLRQATATVLHRTSPHQPRLTRTPRPPLPRGRPPPRQLHTARPRLRK